jgi:hypothetical protein
MVAVAGGSGTKIVCEFRQRDSRQALAQERLGFGESARERPVDCLLDKARGVLEMNPDRKQLRRSQGLVDVLERDFAQVAGNLSAAAVSLGGRDEPLVAQPGERAPHDDCIGAHAAGELLGGDRPFLRRHVEQGVEGC